MGTFLGGVMLDRRTYRSRAVAGVTLVAVDVATDEVLPTLSLVDQATPSPVTTNGDGAYSDFYIADRDIARLTSGGVSQVVVSAEVLAGQARSLAQPVATSADLPAVERDGSLRITEDDLHLWVWEDSIPGWEDLGPLQGEKGEPGSPGLLAGLVEVAPGAWQPSTEADTGWRRLDTTSVSGSSIRSATNPGTLELRRVGFAVYARMFGVGMTAGTGAGFLYVNAIPSGFRAANLRSSVSVGDSWSSTWVHDLAVADNDVRWSYMTNGSGVTSARSESSRLEGGVSWHTDDPWPTTLPGTAV